MCPRQGNRRPDRGAAVPRALRASGSEPLHPGKDVEPGGGPSTQAGVGAGQPGGQVPLPSQSAAWIAPYPWSTGWLDRPIWALVTVDA